MLFSQSRTNVFILVHLVNYSNRAVDELSGNVSWDKVVNKREGMFRRTADNKVNHRKGV